MGHSPNCPYGYSAYAFNPSLLFTAHTATQQGRRCTYHHLLSFWKWFFTVIMSADCRPVSQLSTKQISALLFPLVLPLLNNVTFFSKEDNYCSSLLVTLLKMFLNNHGKPAVAYMNFARVISRNNLRLKTSFLFLFIAN